MTAARQRRANPLACATRELDRAYLEVAEGKVVEGVEILFVSLVLCERPREARTRDPQEWHGGGAENPKDQTLPHGGEAKARTVDLVHAPRDELALVAPHHRQTT